MKLSRLFFLAVSLAGPCLALPTFPLTFTDLTAAQNPLDVFGNPEQFDITSLQFTNFNSATKTFTTEIYFNYGGGVSLAAFNGYNVGDLLFTQGTNRYFVPLVSRTGVTAGSLYSTSSFQTAGSIVSYAGRPTLNVWGTTTGASLIGTGSVNSVVAPSQPDPKKLVVTLNFVANNAFINGFDGSTFSFAAATCANDIITGTIPGSPVPEPGTWAMLGAGLVALGLLRRRQA